MSRTVPVAIALLALLLAPRPAHAQLTVTWTAPAGCPTSESVQAEVIRLLGGALPEELALEADEVGAVAAVGDAVSAREQPVQKDR